jgi:DsbC/DsbD-like thiol-disulfide interchange protein
MDPAIGTLVAEHKSVAPGGTITVGLRIEMEKGWHVYWTNPGDSGLAARVKWTAPKGIKIQPLAWPAPHRVPEGPLMMYGYDGVVLLLADVTVPAEFKGKSVEVSAEAEWLVCSDVCLEGGVSQSLAIPVMKDPLGAGSVDTHTTSAKLFRETRAQLPKGAPAKSLRVQESGETLRLRIDTKLVTFTESTDAYFYPVRAGFVTHAQKQEILRTKDAAILVLPRGGSKPFRSLGGKSLTGVLVLKDGEKRRAFAVEVPIRSKIAKETPKENRK